MYVHKSISTSKIKVTPATKKPRFHKAKDYGKVHDGQIWSIATSLDSEYLFTSDNYGNVQQMRVPDQQ